MSGKILRSYGILSRQLEELKESYEEKLEDTFEVYKEAIKEHAYQCAMNNLEDDYVPLDEFTAEQEKVEVHHMCYVHKNLTFRQKVDTIS